MPSSRTPEPRRDAGDKELALWMLERMRHSESFLEDIRAARSAGDTDILDRPEYVAQHRKRLAHLYQGGDEKLVEISEDTADRLQLIATQGLLSCDEHVLEKALASFLAANPKIAATVPADWPTTLDAAKAEVEGRTKGRFRASFTADLATAARSELDRRAEAERARDHGRES